MRALFVILVVSALSTACSSSDLESPDETTNPTSTTVARSPGCAVPEFGSDAGLLAFYNPQTDGVGHELFVLNLANGEVQQLTDNDAEDLNPEWSPDGSKILFYSDRDGDYDIFVHDYANGGVQKLIDHDANDTGASWSPDGTRIAFQSDRDGDEDIYLMDVDGGDILNLTDDNPGVDGLPRWSSDGARIAFITARGGYRAYMMNADGSDPTDISGGLSKAGFPVWSSTGEQVAFNTALDGRRAIAIVDTSGTEPTMVLPLGGGWPVWSRSDERIAFSSGELCGGGDWEIFLSNLDGTGVVPTGVPGFPWSWRD